MIYEVIISTTIAMVLLPLNFWVAAELVMLVGLLTIFWELRDGLLNAKHDVTPEEACPAPSLAARSQP